DTCGAGDGTARVVVRAWQAGRVKHSEFWHVVDEVLGEAYGRSLAADLVLPGAGNRTAREALEAGVPPRTVWNAVCDELDLDETARWHHRVDPRNRKR